MSEIKLTQEDLYTINELVDKMCKDKRGVYCLFSPDIIEFCLPSSLMVDIDYSLENVTDICCGTQNISISYISWNYEENNVDIFLHK